MAFSYLTGRVAACYYNQDPANNITTGSESAINTWLGLNTVDNYTLLADNLMDASYNVDSEFADATTRETAKSGFASNVAVLKNGQVTFSMRWLPSTTLTSAAPFNFTQAIIYAWLNDTTLTLAFLDFQTNKCPNYTQWGGTDAATLAAGNTIAPQGLVANWNVSLSKEESLRDVQKANVTLSISDSARWHTCAVMNP